MGTKGYRLAVTVLAGFVLFDMAQRVHAQNFGSLIINRKKITLQRKLPPTGHIEGTTIKVEVIAPSGIQGDVPTDLKSSLESILLRNDSRLRTEESGRPDTTISCRVTSYSLPQAQMTQQATLNPGSKAGSVQNQPMARVTGVLTVSFTARDSRSGRSLAADNVTARFDQEYTATGANQGMLHSVTHTVTHLTKGGTDDDTPPTAVELHNRLIENAAQQIAAHLVNTSEQVEIYLAKGGALDQADKLMEGKLWTRALEQLETMTPFGSKEDDAYRLYDLGVVNEALAYQAEDIARARKYLQEASIDYGKAIDAKPTEKYFLQPQTRIDTALAHYKMIGDQKSVTASSAGGKTASASSSSASPKAAPADAMTNDEVIAMVSAKMDTPNIVDTIQHAPAVSFDLSVKGQVDLTRNGVPGAIITAMKARARTTSAHRTSTAAPKSTN